MKPKQPLFITLEGGEGSGKTTLMHQLKGKLSSLGYDVVATREPGGTPLGDQIRQWVLNRDLNLPIGNLAELLLFLAARAQHVEEVISPALNQGKIVICDRFNDSTVAYQGIARGLGVEMVEKYCEMACQTILPTLTFYLDLPPEIGLERTKKLSKDSARCGTVDRIESEKLAFHQAVRDALCRLAQKNPKRIHQIDATNSIEWVFEEVLTIILRVLH